MKLDITKEQRAKIFALYLPCDCINVPSSAYDSIIRMTSINLDSGWISGTVTTEKSHGYSTGECTGYKLLLRDINDITDDDAFEVARVCNVKSDDLGYLKYVGAGICTLWFLDCTPWGGDQEYDTVQTRDLINMHCRFYIPAVVDYLRSRGYALPYKGSNLFELGVAVKKSPTNIEP